MGKTNKKSATKVEPTLAVASPTKSAMNGKRDAAEVTEKKVAKKQKIDKKLQQILIQNKEPAKLAMAASKNGTLAAPEKVEPAISPDASENDGESNGNFSEEEKDTNEGAAIAAVKLEPSNTEALNESPKDDSDEVGDEASNDDSEGNDDSADGSDEDPQKKKQGSDVEMLDGASPKADAEKGDLKTGKKDLETPNTPETESSVSKTLFVGNISFNTEQTDMESFFKDAGEIVSIRFASHPDGSSKGFAHIEFASVEGAQKALELNGKDFLGRAVRLDMARERGSDTHSGKESNKRGREQGRTVFVRGFDKALDEDEIRNALEDHFASCGELTRISIPKDSESGDVKGFAYIELDSAASLNKALELNGSDLGGYSLTVEVARPKVDSRGSSGGGRGGGQSRGRSSGGRGGRGRGGGRGGRGRGGGRGGGGRRT